MNPATETMPRGTAYAYIRFSKDDQRKGHSLERQIANVKAFAESKKLGPIDTTSFRDLGVSAYSGANIAKGSALSEFLEKMRAGEIGKGDWLVIENLDRLSRRNLEEAFPLLTSITNSGISVATVQDGQIYRKNGFDFPTFMRAGLTQELAHQESKKKSERLCAAWAAKRALLGEKKLTALCPGWLSLLPDRKKFTVIKERAAVVRRIFTETADGKGRGAIANGLNRDGVPTWRDGDGWTTTTVGGVLFSRAVIGEFTPCKMEAGKRVPISDPIKGYFPRIISDTEFYAARSVIKSRRNQSGKAVNSCNNLFTGIAFCGECGGPIHYVNKGRGQTDLRCDRAARKLRKCRPYNCKYGSIELPFIKWCVHFDFSGGQKSVRREKEAQLAVIEGKRQESETRLANLAEAIASASKPPVTLVHLLEKTEQEIDSYRGTEARLKAEIHHTKGSIAGIDFQQMATNPDNRFRLREEIRRRVENITIHFRVPDDWPDADSFFTVKLKDGSYYRIISEDTVEHWTKEGKRYFTEPEPPDDWPDVPEPSLPIIRKRSKPRR
jgi:DNA invertase Pin-like site-specific DNA recombinase